MLVAIDTMLYIVVIENNLKSAIIYEFRGLWCTQNPTRLQPCVEQPLNCLKTHQKKQKTQKNRHRDIDKGRTGRRAIPRGRSAPAPRTTETAMEQRTEGTEAAPASDAPPPSTIPFLPLRLHLQLLRQCYGSLRHGWQATQTQNPTNLTSHSYEGWMRLSQQCQSLHLCISVPLSLCPHLDAQGFAFQVRRRQSRATQQQCIQVCEMYRIRMSCLWRMSVLMKWCWFLLMQVAGNVMKCWVRTIGIGVWIQMQCSFGTEECPNTVTSFLSPHNLATLSTPHIVQWGCPTLIYPHSTPF